MAAGKNKRKDKRQHNRIHKKKSTPVVLPKIKTPAFTCSMCGKIIKDLSSALTGKTDRQPVHFDCVLDHLRTTEVVQKHEELRYIGRGCFAVLAFSNPANKKEFTIVRTIEWEDKSIIPEWRKTVADLFSKT